MKNYVSNGYHHFKTIQHHRKEVRKCCFKAGIPVQGILHDLSKYSPTEFKAGVKYWYGTKSPNVGERMELGYSAAWLHHKGRNKHHFEYWFDNSTKAFEIIPVDMPNRYIIEMVCDRIAACKIYLGEKYTDASALQYFNRFDYSKLMTEYTRETLRMLLTMLAEKGEDETFAYMRKIKR